MEMFIYAEFEIINVFFKERRSKYKPAYALNIAQFSKLFMFIPRFQFGHGNLVYSHGKVLEIHWSKCVRTLTISIHLALLTFTLSAETTV